MNFFQIAPLAWLCLLRLSVMLAAFLTWSLNANATDLPVYGGPGGQFEFVIECPEGSFVTGFSGRAGKWVDNLTVNCTRLDKQTWKLGGTVAPQAVPPTALRSAGTSPGGSPSSSSCPDQYVVMAANFWFLRQSEGGLLDWFQVQCSYLPEYRPQPYEINFPFPLQADDGIDTSYPFSGWYACPAGEAVSGIQGFSGLFVDAIGLVCRPLGESPKQREERLHRDLQVYKSPFSSSTPRSFEGRAVLGK
jgi:hypothetical protein